MFFMRVGDHHVKIVHGRGLLCAVMIGLFFSFLVSPPAVGQIYKCVSHGHVAYQDTPCPGQAATTLIGGASASKRHVPGMHSAAVVRMPPALDERAFKAPASMSLLEIYQQFRMLGKREHELHKGMLTEMKALGKEFRASVKKLKSKQEIMAEWASQTRKNARRTKKLSAEGSRQTREFANELRAVSAKPIPSGNRWQRRKAMKTRQEALSRIHQEWMPKIHQNERDVSASMRAGEQQNRRYETKLDSFDRKRDIRVLRNRYRAEAARVRNRWQPRIVPVEKREKALQAEIHRRCPRGAALSPGRQRCYK